MDAPPLRPAAPPRSSASGERARFEGAGLRRAAFGAALLATSGTVSAFTVGLAPAAPKTAYLQVGVGTFSSGTGAANCANNGGKACYDAGGTPQPNATVNKVSVTLAANAVGTGSLPMTTDSAAANSFYDGYTFCNPATGQLYIGGFFRTTTGAATAAAQVTATVPAALTDATGDSIPFSKISWSSSGMGDGAGEPFPAGTFVNGGVQNVGSMATNTWNESCLTFSYLNNTVPPGGIYTGRVLYTLTTP